MPKSKYVTFVPYKQMATKIRREIGLPIRAAACEECYFCVTHRVQLEVGVDDASSARSYRQTGEGRCKTSSAACLARFSTVQGIDSPSSRLHQPRGQVRSPLPGSSGEPSMAHSPSRFIVSCGLVLIDRPRVIKQHQERPSCTNCNSSSTVCSVSSRTRPRPAGGVPRANVAIVHGVSRYCIAFRLYARSMIYDHGKEITDIAPPPGAFTVPSLLPCCASKTTIWRSSAIVAAPSISSVCSAKSLAV